MARARIGQDLVAVDDRAGRVDGQAPVGVAVEGEAEVGVLAHDRRPQVVEVGRSAAVVDGVARPASRGSCARVAPAAANAAGATRDAAPLAQSSTTLQPVERGARRVATTWST